MTPCQTIAALESFNGGSGKVAIGSGSSSLVASDWVSGRALADCLFIEPSSDTASQCQASAILGPVMDAAAHGHLVFGGTQTLAHLPSVTSFHATKPLQIKNS